ncbi:tetratricopeptide repeat protein [Streptomyces catenulae]|uniref:Tetratricopeptide repeat protein n=1 Tax=Streptomyces catenulae TaxID=66875 RepID=A0ABV2Z0Z4_9ACTN|nr:tetratricopeptide repeat protein [Streptomyces catenulae]
MGDGGSFRAEAREGGRVHQAGRDLYLTYAGPAPEPDGTADAGPPPEPADLTARFAEAPLPAHTLDPQALAAVPLPDPGPAPADVAEAVAALAVEDVPAAVPTAPRGTAHGPVRCLRPPAARPGGPARPASDAWAAALLDRALLRSADAAELPLFAPHVRALLWRAGATRPAPVAAARRLRDGYERCGAYEAALPFAERIVACPAGEGLADALALGRLRVRCGDHAEAETVLRPVLARADAAACARGLTLAGNTGPSLGELLRENAEGPFTGKLSTVDGDVLVRAADVLTVLAEALHGQRRYAESERLLHSATGLYWRILGAAHPARILTQLHRARSRARQRLWSEALSLLHDALAFRDAEALARDHPRAAALIRLTHAGLADEAIRGLAEDGPGRTRAVGMFPAPVVRFLDATVSKPPKPTPADADRLATEAAAACESAYGPWHPRTRTARELLARREGADG